MMTEQIKPLTSLRGIAALMIVTHHFFRFLLPSLGNTTDLYTKFITNAYLWVDFFFVLSGFILTHVYAKTLVYNLNRIKMRQFLFSRFSRIYPLHLFMLLPFIGIELLKLTYNQYQHFKGNFSPDLPQAFSGLYSIPDLIASVFLLQNFTFYPAFGDLSFGDTRWNQPAWSISADWLAYLIFPFLLVLLFKIGIKARIFALLASLVGLLFAAGPFPHGSLDAAGIIGLVRCILECSVGILSYRVFHYLQSSHSSSFSSLIGTDLTLTTSLILIFIVMHYNLYNPLALPVFCLLIVASALNRGLVGRILSSQPLVFIGTISYSIYMVHWFIQVFINYVCKNLWGVNLGDLLSLNQSIVAFGVAITSVVATATITYFCIEDPMRSKLKRSFFVRQLISGAGYADSSA